MNAELAPHTTLTVQAGSRPIRIAYLVDPSQHDPEQVDAIILSSIACWGGRHRGFFPVVAGEIPSAWWPALEAFDPDAVVSLVPLEQGLTDQIVRRLLPYGIFSAEVEPPLGQRRIFRDPVHAVDVFGVLQGPGLDFGLYAPPRFLNLYEREQRNPEHSFILRNFGLLLPTAGVQTAFERVEHVDIPADTLAPSALLGQLADLGYNAVTPLQLSALGCSPLGLPFVHDHIRQHLHVVVGSSTLDAMLAWNRALFTGGQHRHRSLWVPLRLLEQDEFRTALVSWMNRTGWQQNQSLRLISYEHSPEEMAPTAEKLRAQLYSFVQCETLAVEASPFPPLEDVARRWVHMGKVHDSSRQVTESVSFADGSGTMAVAAPPLADSRFNQAEWMVDVVVPHRPEEYSHTNVRLPWTLPKRLSFGPSFFPGLHKARITATGLPSVCVSSSSRRIDLRIPTDRELFYWCIAPRQTVGGHTEPPRPVFQDLAASDAGRRLRGMLQVFGGYFNAVQTFEDPFWRNTLMYMAGERNAATLDRSQVIEQALQSYLASGALTIEAGSPELPALAHQLSRALVPTERRRSRLSPAELRRRFPQVRGASLADTSAGNYWEVRTSFDEIQERVLKMLLDLGVLFLGIEVRCPQCGVQHWIKVDDARARMSCPGCETAFALPSEPEWCYQLNDLVGSALRTAGSLATLEALWRVSGQSFNNEPFVYLPPQNIYKADNNGPFTDVDLMCLSEGAFVIGEVKSKATGFREHDITLLGEVARAIRPHKVCFASPPGQWDPAASAARDALQRELGTCGVRVERLDLHW